LVGTARKDGQQGANALMAYLETLPPEDDPQQAIRALDAHLRDNSGPVIRKGDFFKLADIEEQIANQRGLELFKFDTNEEMFEAIGMPVLE
jgi:hypothetical protein